MIIPTHRHLLYLSVWHDSLYDSMGDVGFARPQRKMQVGHYQDGAGSLPDPPKISVMMQSRVTVRVRAKVTPHVAFVKKQLRLNLPQFC